MDLYYGTANPLLSVCGGLFEENMASSKMPKVVIIPFEQTGHCHTRSCL